MTGGKSNTLPHLFEDCVAKNKNNQALIFGKTFLTYEELCTQSNKLSHYLITEGVASGSHVGLCMERSPELVIAILAITKAGGVYVPLDPQYPPARLSFILADAEIQVLLTVREFNNKFSEYNGNIICFDDITDTKAVQPSTNPKRQIDQDSPAYIMYTSGSTGKPKGVVVPHRGVVRLVRDTDYVPFGPDLVFLLLSSISFDASTFELWGALLNGAKCVIFPDALPTLTRLEKTLDQHKVNVLWLTAALFNTVIDETPWILQKLDYLLTGGEALSVPHVRKALVELPRTQLVNGYGPTENTTFACCFSIPNSLPQNITSVPIGKPISGTYLRILNENHEPVADGDIGELFIGGSGLALGYLNRPALTSEIFIPDKFSKTNGRLLYKSGDLVRCLPDGNIEFVGRTDNQLKIRGYRIEPGEIERTLAQHSSVKTVAVIPRKDQTAHTALVAFLTVNSSASLSIQDLKAYLKERLPFYLIPDFIEILDRLPITPNGKVDRKLLSERPLRTERKAGATALSEKEALVVALWQKLLEVATLSLHENLLDYGVDSLSIVRFISRLDESGYTLAFPQFYAKPTVAGIAKMMQPTRKKSKEHILSGTKQLTSGKPLPLSSAQQSVFFLDRLLPGNPAYRFQAALHLKGDVKIDILEQVINAIVARHQILRTTFPDVDGTAQQVIHPPWNMKIPVIDLRNASEASQAYQDAINKCLALPIQIDQLPLFHHRIIRLRKQQYVLVIVEHHIIHDGCAFASMISELVELYRAAIKKKNAMLPSLPWQYADYACLEKTWLTGAVLHRHERFWKKYLRGAPNNLALPLDHPRPIISNFQGTIIDVFLDQDLSNLLRHQARKHGISLFALMLAVYFVLLHRLANQEDIVVGTGVANRLTEEVQKMLGMFVNTIPIRATVSGKQSFSSFCRQLNARTSQALQYQGLPLRNILHAANLKTHYGETPLINTMFNFHDSRFPELKLPGVSGAIEYLHNNTAKFDMNIIAIPDTEYCHRTQADIETSGILLLWEYSTELFSAHHMHEIVESYVALLRQAVNNPEQEIAHLKVPRCRNQIPPEVTDTAIGTSSASPLHAASEKINLVEKIRKTFSCYTVILSFFPMRWLYFRMGEKKPTALRFITRIKKIVTSFGKQRSSSNMTEQLIIELWQEILGIEAIEEQDNFFDLGGDSLNAVVLASRIYQRTGMDLPVSSLFTNPTVSGLAQALINNQSETTDLVLRTEDNSPILFYFHGDYTGGGLYTKKMIELLKPGFDVVVLHPQGQPGQPPPQTIEDMARRYIEIMRRHQKQGPFFLAGHCNGALVAYEIARQLKSSGQETKRLILLDPATPCFSGETPFSQKDIHDMLDGKTACDIRSLEADERADFLLKAYLKICRGYIVKPYNGDTVLLLARHSETVTDGRAAGWKPYIQSLETIKVPGGHHTMFTKHMDAVAKCLHQIIIRAISSVH